MEHRCCTAEAQATEPSDAVCVVIVNYNGAGLTVACLDSLMAGTRVPTTIMVCDNASGDGSAEEVEAWAGERFPLVRALPGEPLSGHAARTDETTTFLLVRNPGNLGFSAGNNAGLRLAPLLGEHGFYWLLNNDTACDPQCLEALLSCARARPGVGIFGATVVEADRSGRVQCAGGCAYSPLTTILRPALAGQSVDQVRGAAEPRLDYVLGASFFLRAELLTTVGLLDEALFLFCEELDYCDRARARGYSLGWCRDAVVAHVGSASFGKLGECAVAPNWAIQYHENLSTLLYTARHHPACLPFAAIFRLFAKAVLNCPPSRWGRLAPVLAAYADFLRNRRRHPPARARS